MDENKTSTSLIEEPEKSAGTVSQEELLALVQELNVPINELPDAYQEMIRPGKGFDTQDELDRWLESIDS